MTDLGFTIADDVVDWGAGGCRSATDVEIALWGELSRLSADLDRIHGECADQGREIVRLTTERDEWKRRAGHLEAETAHLTSERDELRKWKEESWADIKAERDRYREALESIANGDGYYGAQAREHKEIARASLSPTPTTGSERNAD